MKKMMMMMLLIIICFGSIEIFAEDANEKEQEVKYIYGVENIVNEGETDEYTICVSPYMSVCSTCICELMSDGQFDDIAIFVHNEGDVAVGRGYTDAEITIEITASGLEKITIAENPGNIMVYNYQEFLGYFNIPE